MTVVVAMSGYAEVPDLLAPLTPGRYSVGFAEWEHDGLTVSAWYPARGDVRSPMQFTDYLGEGRAAFREFLTGAGVSSDGVERYLGARMRAGRAAPAIRRPFPLILVAQGNQHGAADQTPLCEYLASHGYVVATTPSPMIRKPMTDASQIGPFAETQAAELRAAIDAVSRRFPFRQHQIAVVGHSFGARAGLLLAMTDRRIGALVSLDGGIGSATGVEAMKRSQWFRTGHVPPVLHLYEREDAFMQPDFTLLQSVGARALHTEQVFGLHHAHFTTTGFAAAAVPELAALTRAPADVAPRLAQVADRTLRFLKIYLSETRE